MMITNRSRRYVEELASISALFEAGRKFRADGKDPIDLSIGNPIVKPPSDYFDALRDLIEESASADSNHHGYSPIGGFPEARQRLAAELGDMLSLDFESSDVFFTAGATNALDVVLATILEPEDEVILIAPYFIEYPNLIDVHHGHVVVAEAGLGETLDVEEVGRRITAKTKAIIINSPNNPTGAVYSADELATLADMLNKKNDEYGLNIVVIEDASYNHILFNDTPLASIICQYDYTIFSSSFSKSLSIAGERLGFFAVSPHIMKKSDERQAFLAALTVYLRMRVVHAPALQQRVFSSIGINCSVDASIYDQRQRALSECLEDLKFTFNRPDGGFYIFAELPTQFSSEIEFRTLAHSGDDPLLYVPGTAFGGDRYGRHIRLSTCVSARDIDRACRKLRSMVILEEEL